MRRVTSSISHQPHLITSENFRRLLPPDMESMFLTSCMRTLTLVASRRPAFSQALAVPSTHSHEQARMKISQRLPTADLSHLRHFHLDWPMYRWTLLEERPPPHLWAR